MTPQRVVLAAAFVCAAAGFAARAPISCPPAEVAKSKDVIRVQTEIKDRILRASRRVKTDAQGYTLWETPKGRYWVPKGSDYVLPFNLAEQERKIYGSGDLFIHTGDVVLDCGANMGVFVREALDAGAKLVVAIEPGPENIEVLKRNFAEEIAAGRVIVYPKGVWDKDDMLSLNVDSSNSAADSFVMKPANAKATTIKLPLTTIDKLVAELKLPRVDYIKMDIEGAETRALNGARSTIAKWHPRMGISVYHQPTDPVTIPASIRAAYAGYKLRCGPCTWDEKNKRARPDVFYFY